MRSRTAYLGVVSALLLGGCGGTPVEETKKTTTTSTLPATSTESEDDSSSVFTSSESSDSSDGTEPNYSFRVEQVGYHQDEVTVSAATELKIRFTPGVQDQTVSGSGFSPTYSKLGTYITVGELTQSTGLLMNGVGVGSQQETVILDFSSALDDIGCDDGSSDSGCEKTVTIEVGSPNYDYWCFNYGMYCSHTHVYTTHPWNAQIDVETEDTLPLE